MELLLSDCEIQDYQNIDKASGNFASQKVTVLTEKIQAAQKDITVLGGRIYEQVLSLETFGASNLKTF